MFAVSLILGSSSIYSQNIKYGDCNFSLLIEQGAKEKFTVSMISIRGVKRNTADKILQLMSLRRGDQLCSNKDSLCSRFREVNVYKKYYLSDIKIVRDSSKGTTEESSWIKFTFLKME